MLTIERVKELLNDPTISDHEAEEIRNGFDALVRDVVFEQWLDEKNKIKQNKN